MAVAVIMKIRLDKYLADMGCGTRSQVKQEISKGRVTVNGTTVKRPEYKVDSASDQVCWQGSQSPMQSLNTIC